MIRISTITSIASGNADVRAGPVVSTLLTAKAPDGVIETLGTIWLTPDEAERHADRLYAMAVEARRLVRR